MATPVGEQLTRDDLARWATADELEHARTDALELPADQHAILPPAAAAEARGVFLPNTERHLLPVLDHGPRLQTRGVVIHVNVGTFDGTIAFFTRGSRGIGAHVEIGSERVWQLVDLRHKCFHAVAANAFAIGLEHAGFGRSRAEWLEAGHELAYSANRAAWILHEYNLGRPHVSEDPSRGNIWPHFAGGAAWGGHTCPEAHAGGHAFPWDVYERLLHDAYFGHWGRR